MNLKLKYITDNTGRKKSVLISQKQWEHFHAEHLKIKNKLRIVLGIQNALEEVREIQKGNKKGKALKTVLDEL